MSTSIHDYEYHLPSELIAQTPASPRESAKLMVVRRDTKTYEHHTVKDLPTFFHTGDVIVINNTKVFRARLHGMIEDKKVELFLVRPLTQTHWLALGKPGKRFTRGIHVRIANDFIATILAKNDDGTLVVDFHLSAEKTIKRANLYGSIPIPPYIKTIPGGNEYQTSYAKYEGSVAAPTAGFHLTTAILASLKEKGVQIVEITLHVGLGTFLPIKTDTLEEHAMHTEWAHITEDAANTVTRAKKENRRVIAIGTTTVRTLEGVAALHGGSLTAYEGEIGLFIKPGFTFAVIDAMLTNFHLPKSTLLVLISAFAGRELVLHAYEEAVAKKYRFYSFGDAMLIL